MNAEWRRILDDPRQRLRVLYAVQPKKKPVCHFTPRPEQERLLDRFWYLNYILKSRKIGFSTLLELLGSDFCGFNKDYRALVIDESIEKGKDKIEMARLAWSQIGLRAPGLDDQERRALHSYLHANFGIDPKKDNAESLTWKNGSTLRVTTSSRGGNPHFLHVSELGPIALDKPKKAAEIRSGAFESIADGNIATIETTHKGGQFGVAYELCKLAMQSPPRERMTSQDFQFHFFPWYVDLGNQLRLPDGPFFLPDHIIRYFDDLAKRGLLFTDEQKLWYSKKAERLGADMLKEQPTTPEEALNSPVDGAIYGDRIQELRSLGRVNQDFGYDPLYPVHTFWDVGRSDSTAIWAIQLRGPDILVLDWYENEGEDYSHYCGVIRDWKARYRSLSSCFLPHDCAHKVFGAKISVADRIKTALTDLRLKIEVLPVTPNKWDGINEVRRLLKMAVFHRRCCESRKLNGEDKPAGIAHLEHYRKRVNVAGGVGKEEPVHDLHSHSADAFRTFAEAMALGRVSRDFVTERDPMKRIQRVGL
jgi:hypothetical protein